MNLEKALAEAPLKQPEAHVCPWCHKTGLGPRPMHLNSSAT